MKRVTMMAAMAGLMAAAWAQEADEAASKKTREVRVWAVGDAPPFRHEIRNGVAYELEPPAGSLPPRELAVVGVEGEELGRMRVSLGRPTAGVGVAAGAKPLRLRDVSGAAEWHRFGAPEAGDFTLLCWRGAGKAGWGEPRVMLVPEGAREAQGGRMRLINVSGVKLAVVWGKEKLQVESGKTVERKYGKAEEVSFQVGLVDAKGVLRRIHSAGVPVDPREKTTVVVYRADGQEVRRPVKVAVVREPVSRN